MLQSEARVGSVPVKFFSSPGATAGFLTHRCEDEERFGLGEVIFLPGGGMLWGLCTRASAAWTAALAGPPDGDCK